MIRAHLTKRVPGGRDAAGLSIDVELESASGVTALFGPAGAGKTLILDLIAGFARPDAGRILLHDEILFDAAAQVNFPSRRRNCSYLFRNCALFPHMTVRENLVFAAERLPRLERHRRVNEMLDRFDLATAAALHSHQLTPAQTQRAVMARAVIGGPRLLLLDQPSSGLDAMLRRELYDLVRRVRSNFKIPMLLATTDLEECLELADEMFVLGGGRILQSGAPRKILDQPASVDVARLLGIPNLFEAEVIALDPGRNTSRLRFQDSELQGCYFPGRLLGDRVWLCVRADELRVLLRNGSKPGPNQVPAQLLRSTEGLHTLRLEFSGGIAAEVPRETLSGRSDHQEFLIEFPAASLRVL